MKTVDLRKKKRVGLLMLFITVLLTVIYTNSRVRMREGGYSVLSIIVG
jgi:hypothetical protein